MRTIRYALGVLVLTCSSHIASAGCVPDKPPKEGWANLRAVLECIERKTVPSGTIAFFPSADCPEDSGWTRANELSGRYVVGLDPRYPQDAGATVGKPLESKEARPAGAHTHDFSEIGLKHKGNIQEGLRTEWYGESSVRLNKNDGQTQPAPRDAGSTNAPYVQLSACRKK